MDLLYTDSIHYDFLIPEAQWAIAQNKPHPCWQNCQAAPQEEAREDALDLPTAARPAPVGTEREASRPTRGYRATRRLPAQAFEPPHKKRRSAVKRFDEDELVEAFVELTLSAVPVADVCCKSRADWWPTLRLHCLQGRSFAFPGPRANFGS